METVNLPRSRLRRPRPTVETLTEWRLGPRSVLRPGDRFKATGGPYWRTAGGDRIPLAVRGTCRLVAIHRQRSRVYLVVETRGGTAVLHVAGRRRNRLMPQLVCRPYKIRRKK